MSRSSDPALGELLSVVRPHPLSILIFCLPGLFVVFTVCVNLPDYFRRDPGDRGSPAAVAGLLLLGLVLLWLFGLRHIRDRAEYYRFGFRFKGRTYLFSEIGPITFTHSHSSGFTRFMDYTGMNFTHAGKPVCLGTRCLLDLSYQYYRTYDARLEGEDRTWTQW